MHISTVSPQGQTTIPAWIRQKLSLKPGKSLSWIIQEDVSGDVYAKVFSPTARTIQALRGIGKQMYQSLGGGTQHLKQERKTWEKPSV